MRRIFITGLAVATALLAGVAQAQIKPIAPIAPIGGVKPVEAKPTPGFQPFKPYEPPKPPKPFAGVDTNTAPSGFYPEQHRKPKKTGGF